MLKLPAACASLRPQLSSAGALVWLVRIAGGASAGSAAWPTAVAYHSNGGFLSVSGTYNGSVVSFSDQMGVKAASGLDAFVWKMSAGQTPFLTTFAFFTGTENQE